MSDLAQHVSTVMPRVREFVREAVRVGVERRIFQVQLQMTKVEELLRLIRPIQVAMELASLSRGSEKLVAHFETYCLAFCDAGGHGGEGLVRADAAVRHIRTSESVHLSAFERFLEVFRKLRLRNICVARVLWKAIVVLHPEGLEKIAEIEQREAEDASAA